MASSDLLLQPGERATAVFAGGCFWCVEAVFAELRGVEAVTSGYTGGSTASPTYEAVCSGTTGHAEAARIMFDPAVITYEDLLLVFFSVHDPTTPNRQGNDLGTQYRSAIFFLDEAQKRSAERIMAELRASGAFGAPIVTELSPLTIFYPAEVYHQKYYANNSGQPYCSSVIGPKLAKFRHLFKDRLQHPENAE